MDRFISKSFIHNDEQQLINKNMFLSQNNKKMKEIVADVSFNFPVTENSFKQKNQSFFDYDSSTHQTIFNTEIFFTTFNISNMNNFQVGFKIHPIKKITSVTWIMNKLAAYSQSEVAYIFDVEKGLKFRELKIQNYNQEFCCIRGGQKHNQFSNNIFCIGDNYGSVFFYDLRKKGNEIESIKLPNQDFSRQMKFKDNFFSILTENSQSVFKNSRDFNRSNVNVFDVRNLRSPFQKIMEKNLIVDHQWYKNNKIFYCTKKNGSFCLRKKIFNNKTDFVLYERFQFSLVVEDFDMIIIFSHVDFDTQVQIYCTKKYTKIQSFNLLEVSVIRAYFIKETQLLVALCSQGHVARFKLNKVLSEKIQKNFIN